VHTLSMTVYLCIGVCVCVRVCVCASLCFMCAGTLTALVHSLLIHSLWHAYCADPLTAGTLTVLAHSLR